MGELVQGVLQSARRGARINKFIRASCHGKSKVTGMAVNSTLGFTARASLTVEGQNELRQSHVTLTMNCRYLLRGTRYLPGVKL